MINLTKKKTKKKEEAEEESEEQGMSLVDLLTGNQADIPESRSIMFVGEVTEEKAAEFVSALLVLAQTKDEEEERAEDIKIYINTYGGSADETKGKRFLSSHCRVMIHAVNGGHIGELHNLQNEMEQMAGLQDSYIQALSAETNMTKRQITSLINKKINIYLDAEQAIEKGLADEVWNG
jgi:ATP-dependent protease ClpP protease subunit